jgi:hypothetical protein
LPTAGELDFALEVEAEEALIEGDHRLEVRRHEADFNTGAQQVEAHGHDTTQLADCNASALNPCG